MRTSFTKPILPAKHSGRLELARWMASSEHPLTARVIVNRVWRWHFGQGIVSSTDNFGILGGKPSHPELLDWLARTFIESGWSIKDLHRLIMKSATYQQASSVSFLDVGQGRSAHRRSRRTACSGTRNIQRLEAEEIRDAMLAACGWLEPGDRRQDHPAAQPGIRLQSHQQGRHDLRKPAPRALSADHSQSSLRHARAVRLSGPDHAHRQPQQHRHRPAGAHHDECAGRAWKAASVSRRSWRALPDDEQRVQQAYALLYGRPPLGSREVADALALVHDFSATEPPERAWALLCQTLFAANEFIYLR